MQLGSLMITVQHGNVMKAYIELKYISWVEGMHSRLSITQSVQITWRCESSDEVEHPTSWHAWTDVQHLGMTNM